MIATALAKASKKANKPARKATPAPVVELAPIEAMIKVGRWTYPAQIDRNTKVATWTRKLGGKATAQPGEYKMV
jgi:hypothetical protein